MTNTNRCILEDYRKDGDKEFDYLDPHRISIHGLDGSSGRVGSAGVPKNYRYVTIGNSPVRGSQTKVYTLMDRYIETFKRDTDERIKSLYLWSENPGTGKTTTAAALINAWIAVEYLSALKDGRQPNQTGALFVDVNELQTRYNLAAMTKDEEKLTGIGVDVENAQKADFVVLDDTGIRGATEAFASYVHSIINYRTTEDLPTVYTSNLPIEDMAEVFTERLYDRMRDKCVSLFFEGESNRAGK